MDIKRNYYEDIELFKSNTILVWSILFLIFLGILPLLIHQVSPFRDVPLYR